MASHSQGGLRNTVYLLQPSNGGPWGPLRPLRRMAIVQSEREPCETLLPALGLTWPHLASPSKAGSMETPGLRLLHPQLWEVRRNARPLQILPQPFLSCSKLRPTLSSLGPPSKLNGFLEPCFLLRHVHRLRNKQSEHHTET